MSEALATRETTMVASREKRTPDELIAEGKIQATALMKVVQAAGLAKDLGGSKPHLEVEAWQTIGRFNGFLTDIVWTRPVIEGGVKVGYEARAELVSIADGSHLIGAEASCFFDEEIEKRDGTTYKRWGDDYAVRSMAQTRAQSKLGRMAFAWVAVLAGYSGTPAEEMEGVRQAPAAKPIVFPFGKHKDQAPKSLPLEDLQKELAFWTKKAAEEQNPKFKANNERLIRAIQDAIAEKTAKHKSPAEPSSTTVASDAGTGAPASVGEASAGDPYSQPAEPSEIDRAWLAAQELQEALGWGNAQLRDHCAAEYKVQKRTEMNPDQVESLITYMRNVLEKREKPEA